MAKKIKEIKLAEKKASGSKLMQDLKKMEREVDTKTRKSTI